MAVAYQEKDLRSKGTVNSLATTRSLGLEHRERQVVEVQVALKQARKMAFAAYEHLIPDAMQDAIEKNIHHGWSHIRRVQKHSEDNAIHSIEVVHNPQEFAVFANAIALAERFHDIIQQHLNFLGFSKDSKTFHAEFAALYIQLLSPQLRQLGYSDSDIHTAAFFAYYHSEPERITEDAELPAITTLSEWLRTQIEQKRAEGKNIPADLLEYFPGDEALHSQFEAQLRTGVDSFNLLQDETFQRMKSSRSFYARRFAIADKMDALLPPELANIRTVETKEKRPLYVRIDRAVAQKIFQENIGYLQKKIAKAKGQERELLEQQLQEFQMLETEVTLAFQSQEELPVAVELKLRLLSGEIMAEDDLSRILYESLRNYDSLQPTSFERTKIAHSLQRRLHHLKDLVKGLSVGNTQQIERAFRIRLDQLQKVGLKDSAIYDTVLGELSHFTEKIIPHKRIDTSDEARILTLIDQAEKQISFVGAPIGQRSDKEHTYDPVVSLEVARQKLLPHHIQ